MGEGRWLSAAAAGTAAVVLILGAEDAADLAVGVPLALVLVLFGLATSPLLPFLHRPLAEATADDRPVVLWKPGCSVCWRMLVALGRDRRRFSWVNVWRDPAAEQQVRTLQDGDLLTPTALDADGNVIRGHAGERHATVEALRAIIEG